MSEFIQDIFNKYQELQPVVLEAKERIRVAEKMGVDVVSQKSVLATNEHTLKKWKTMLIDEGVQF